MHQELDLCGWSLLLMSILPGATSASLDACWSCIAACCAPVQALTLEGLPDFLKNVCSQASLLQPAAVLWPVHRHLGRGASQVDPGR